MRYSVKTFLKNLKFLMSHLLVEEHRNMKIDFLKSVENFYEFDLKDESKTISCPNILDANATVDLLLNKPKSFIRFGDGELDIMMGKSIAFQEYDEELAKIMYDVLVGSQDNLYVGLMYHYFHSTYDMVSYCRDFYLADIDKYRKFIIQKCNKKRTYISAGFNQMYISMNYFDYDSYFEKIRNLFKDKDIVLFVGQGIMDSFEYDVFGKARNVEYVFGPSKNAFSQYENILSKARQFSTDKLLCFILGPTSKALITTLANEGYIAWDIGHLAKDYNSYMSNVQKDNQAVINYYSPD